MIIIATSQLRINITTTNLYSTITYFLINKYCLIIYKTKYFLPSKVYKVL